MTGERCLSRFERDAVLLVGRAGGLARDDLQHRLELSAGGMTALLERLERLGAVRCERRVVRLAPALTARDPASRRA